MQHRVYSVSKFLAVSTLLAGLAGCDSSTTRNANDPGTAPFAPAAGTTATASPGSAAVAQDASAPTTNPGAPTPDSLHLLSPGRAGRLLLGMREDRIKAVIPASLLRATTYQDKGQTLPAYEMRDAQRPTAPPTILHLIGDSATGFRLRRIRIYDSQYRTAEGIGVGSPFGAARQTLGLTKVRNTPAGFAAVSGEVQMAWVIDPKSLPAKHPEEISSSEIPPAARITGVLLYQ
ncbi:hypothetical protein DNI29_08780 [Hymenobacter sediminis]|uniref:hypothetical protein n=1 Tax=Hymenobacter sediminis TaxID=2218621 RepID=UPI000DA6D25D|nr:hypothetical protein [Hymenobacter sediminis]RPD48696.1 hypothetical protein DNI29_08780 [Hymenobacter sediminis]